MTTRDLLRSALLGTTPKFRTLTITEGELTFEVRQPSIAKRARIFKLAGAQTIVRGERKGKTSTADSTTIDIGRLQIQGILECVYLPGTEENVFGVADIEALQNLPPGGLFDRLADAVTELMEVDGEKKEPNS